MVNYPLIFLRKFFNIENVATLAKFPRNNSYNFADKNYKPFNPISSWKAVCSVEGRLIDLRDNGVIWRDKVEVKEPIEGRWDVPGYPHLAAAINKAIYEAKAKLLANFFANS